MSVPPVESWLRRVPPGMAPRLRPWLNDPGSLTARIRARCAHFEVRVLRQASARCCTDEARLFGLRDGARAVVREVLLVADGVPVVFARSLVPLSQGRGAWQVFRRVGSRPLGAWLFADPRVARGTLAFACLDRRDARYHAGFAAAGLAPVPERVWARRSLFRWCGRSLLVTEMFLPGILELSA